MLYSKKYNLLFVAVPKTGTTTFTSALGEVLEAERNVVRFDETGIRCGEHDSLSDIADHVGWDRVKGMTIVGAVRNPWDRLVSSYHFYRNGRVVTRVLQGKQRSVMAILNVIAAKLLPFSLWLRIYRTETCHSYFRDPSGEFRADHLLHLETFDEDVAKLLEVLGLPAVELQKQNESSRTHYRDYYSDRAQEIVARRFAEDVAAFNYSF